MTSNINLYEDYRGYRPDCEVCGTPATYWVLFNHWVEDGSGHWSHPMRDWGCPALCHRCASVNDANRIGTPRRDCDVRYPFTKREVSDPGFTQYTLLNWPNLVVRPPVRPDYRWSREECHEHRWPFDDSHDDTRHPST